ncbi:hypothetical protein CHS0354_028347 [Potamilus streckersoni]|uniref:Double-strand break repair protein n=1 Tax=Potamilus streckersoni TaxID=2493646 RepID=A0AAE0RTR2_9BIVA|nr:hypothetical protein CHS0354_028347 [Potamilus streckersoni]
MPPIEEDQGDQNVFKILVATDIHLGYCEKDAVRGNDSLVTFEEILENAKKYEVDFVLLGGDLFHENKPSRKILHGCLALFRRYCMGEKPVQFELLSDQSVDFKHCQFPVVNYEDPNLNVSIPVFSIHGNHDDPTGQGNLCSLDLMHTAGVVNYFGKTTSLEAIQLSPLLLQKGNTKLSLYGLGSVRDERLHRMFVHKNVTMLRPREDKDDWFNLFVIHQNRSKHSATNYIPEQFLDDFLDLVIWGHEHECRIDPEWNSIQNFYVSQPGSSIATSLSESETVPKHIGLLQIRGKDFKMSKIPLQTVRQFYMKDVVLSDTSLNPADHDIVKKVEAYCQEVVESLLDKAELEHTGNKKQDKKPLIRLRVDYSGGFESFSTYRFGQKFVDRVANPKDLIQFQRKRTISKKESKEDLEELKGIKVENLDTSRVEDMVKDYFAKADQKLQLQVLTERGMGDAVQEFVDKEEREAIKELVTFQLEKTQTYLKNRNTMEELIDEEVCRFREERKKKKEEEEEVREALKRAQQKRPETQGEDRFPDDADQDDMDSDGDKTKISDISSHGRGRQGQEVAKTTRGSRGGGRGSRGSRGRGKVTGVENNQGSSSLLDTFIYKQSRAGQNSGSSSTNTAGKKSKQNLILDEEVDIISSDTSDEDPFNIPSSSRKQQRGAANSSMRNTSSKKRGVVFDSDEEMPATKRKR